MFQMILHIQIYARRLDLQTLGVVKNPFHITLFLDRQV